MQPLVRHLVGPALVIAITLILKTFFSLVDPSIIALIYLFCFTAILGSETFCGVLLGAKIRTSKNFLHAENLDAVLAGLLDDLTRRLPFELVLVLEQAEDLVLQATRAEETHLRFLRPFPRRPRLNRGQSHRVPSSRRLGRISALRR